MAVSTASWRDLPDTYGPPRLAKLLNRRLKPDSVPLRGQSRQIVISAPKRNSRQRFVNHARVSVRGWPLVLPIEPHGISAWQQSFGKRAA